jgi:hypothetical protein
LFANASVLILFLQVKDDQDSSEEHKSGKEDRGPAKAQTLTSPLPGINEELSQPETVEPLKNASQESNHWKDIEEIGTRALVKTSYVQYLNVKQTTKEPSAESPYFKDDQHKVVATNRASQSKNSAEIEKKESVASNIFRLIRTLCKHCGSW